MSILLIKPSELPPAVSVGSANYLVVDNGTTVASAKPAQIVNAGRPIASEQQAVAGVNNTTAMTPLRVAQAIVSVGDPIMQAAEAARDKAQAWAENPEGTAVEPGQYSALHWAAKAEETKQTLLDDLTASATTLSPGSAATATWDGVNQIIALGIPEGLKGDKGDKGDDGINAVPQSSATDSTAGRALLVGAFGLGSKGTAPPPSISFLNNAGLATGLYRFGSAATGTRPAEMAGLAGLLWVEVQDADHVAHVAVNPATGARFVRAYDTGTWTPWTALVSFANAPEAQLGAGNPYATRAAAQSANVLSGVNVLRVLHNGLVLSYVRDATGTALTTSGSVNWSPAGVVHPEHFGAAGDGTTDDVVALQAACDWVEARGGGKVVGAPGANYRISADLNIGVGVLLLGPAAATGFGDFFTANAVSAFGSATGRLLLTAGKTLILASSATVAGWAITPYGVAFPAPHSVGWTGTAITLGWSGCRVVNNLIGGFDLAVKSGGAVRYHVSGNLIDCQNGIDVDLGTDVAWIENNEGWPWFTITDVGPRPPGGGAGSKIMRSGTFLWVRRQDWGYLKNNFSWGYKYGHRLESNSLTVLGGGADNANNPEDGILNTGSIGMWCTASRTTITGFRAAANAQNYLIEPKANATISLSACRAWSASGDVCDGFVFGGADKGRTVISDLNCQNVARGLVLAGNEAAVINLGGHVFTGVPTPFAFDVSGYLLNHQLPNGDFITDFADGTSVVSGSYTIANFTAASDLKLPVRGFNTFICGIGGTSTINTISTGFAGRRIILRFGSTATLAHGTGADKVRLNGSTDFSGSANRTIELFHDGTQWNEIGRSVP